MGLRARLSETQLDSLATNPTLRCACAGLLRICASGTIESLIRKIRAKDFLTVLLLLGVCVSDTDREHDTTYGVGQLCRETEEGSKNLRITHAEGKASAKRYKSERSLK